MQGRAGAGPGGLRSNPRALPPPVLPPPPQFATEQDEMPANQIAQRRYKEASREVCLGSPRGGSSPSLTADGGPRGPERRRRGLRSMTAPRAPPSPLDTVGRVIALICGLLVVILMVLGLASADWLMAAGWRQGLFMHCIDPEAPTPLPFDITAQPGCYAARPAPYIKLKGCG
uniref:SFRICE_019350 n=1 Tax=Spodoptera frugiperda TaxID=7108 RepID=A0A2H1WC99_SPOFR